ncbi:MAG: peptidoglycan-binding protein [Verrucomicrobiota bacterium]|nr:peptidoglycan-binding protein [Verrucomicrobiota bacterium]
MKLNHFLPILLAAGLFALPGQGRADTRKVRAYFDQDGDGRANWHTVKVKDHGGHRHHDHRNHHSRASFSAHYSRPYYSGSYYRPHFGSYYSPYSGSYYSSYHRPYYAGSSFGSYYPYSYSYPYTYGYPRTSIGVSVSRPLYSSSRSVYRGYTYSDDLAVDVQVALKRRGYYYGAIDGDVGPATRAAIRAYQRDRRLSITGRIDTSLLRSLGVG